MSSSAVTKLETSHALFMATVTRMQGCSKHLQQLVPHLAITRWCCKFDVDSSYCRRKQREAKKFGKQVSAEVKKERVATKKQAIDSVSKLRKARAKGGYEGDLDMDAELAKLDRRQSAGQALRGDRMGRGEWYTAPCTSVCVSVNRGLGRGGVKASCT